MVVIMSYKTTIPLNIALDDEILMNFDVFIQFSLLPFSIGLQSPTAVAEHPILVIFFQLWEVCTQPKVKVTILLIKIIPLDSELFSLSELILFMSK